MAPFTKLFPLTPLTKAALVPHQHHGWIQADTGNIVNWVAGHCNKVSTAIKQVTDFFFFFFWFPSAYKSYVYTVLVKNLPANAGNVRDLGWEDPPEEEMATHSSILAWRIPMDRGASRATVPRIAELDTTEATWHAHCTVV